MTLCPPPVLDAVWVCAVAASTARAAAATGSAAALNGWRGEGGSGKPTVRSTAVEVAQPIAHAASCCFTAS